jgi:hypothetical protein
LSSSIYRKWIDDFFALHLNLGQYYLSVRQAQWLTLIIPASWEVEMGGSQFKASLTKKARHGG